MRWLPAPDFSRFLPTWLAFGSWVSLAAFVMMSGSAALTTLEPGSTADAPPLVIFMTAVAVYIVALVVGLFLVPSRKLIIGPAFPFVRPGYGAVALLPFAALALIELTMGQRLVIVAGEEMFIGLSAMIFLAVGRMFGAFDPAEQ